MKDQNEKTEDMDYLDELSGQGFEGIRTKDYAIPFLRVVQPTSPEIIEGDPAYLPGAKAGQFFNTLTRHIYGGEIVLVPIKSEPIWLEYEPGTKDKRGPFKGKHPVNSVEVTGNVYDGMFRTDNGNEIVETVVFYCLVQGHETELPVAFSLSSSMVKHAKSWNALIYSQRTPSGKQAPYYSGYWKLTLSLNQNDSGRWYNIGSRAANVEFISFVSKDVIMIAKKTRELLDSDALKTDYAQIAAPASADSAAVPKAPDVTDY